MRNYNLKKDIAYWEGAVVSLKEVLSELDKMNVYCKLRNREISYVRHRTQVLLAKANMNLANNKFILEEKEHARFMKIAENGLEKEDFE